MTSTTLTRILWIFTSCFLFFSSAEAQCPDNQSELQIIFSADNYPQEISWTLKLLAGFQLEQGGIGGFDGCVPSNTCMTLTVSDSSNDGLNPAEGGGLQVYYQGELIADNPIFTSDFSVSMGCPLGLTCTSAASIETGQHNLWTNEYWYAFEPEQQGAYQISTCGYSNACPLTIWIYDDCAGWVAGYTQAGTINFAQQTCAGGQSETSQMMNSGERYYIRIGTEGETCNAHPLVWSLSYQGEVAGCTDPDACNYNPIATISVPEDCFYNSDPQCSGPDLLVNQEILKNTLEMDVLDNIDQCMIQEGCLNGYGERVIIRFTTNIANEGEQDYFIGNSPSNINNGNELYEWDPCHNHWHYANYAEYVLFDEAGQSLPLGFKMGMCVLDLFCPDGGEPKFDCQNMGITAGCWDQYPSMLDCQWIDVTDLEPGRYTLVVRVNWTQSPDAAGREEIDYMNNWAQVCLELIGDEVITDFVVLEDCELYVDCAGNLLGDAQMDCTGECNGSHLFGDLNNDGAIGTMDAINYIYEGIFSDQLEVSACTDLNDDGEISVTDAMLLIGCHLYEADSHAHPDGSNTSHSHCEFPFTVSNPNQTSLFYLSEANLDEHYFDISIQNTDHFVQAYQFRLEGVAIDLVENIYFDNDYHISLFFNDEGHIIGLPVQEKVLPKNSEPLAFLRIHFDPESSDTGAEACLTSVKAVINGNYEEISGLAAIACTNIETVGTEDFPEMDLSSLEVFPNPVSASGSFRLANRLKYYENIRLYTYDGRLVAKLDALNNEYTLAGLQLPTGLYIIDAIDQNTRQKAKLIIF